jgi:hypothetical protein
VFVKQTLKQEEEVGHVLLARLSVGGSPLGSSLDLIDSAENATLNPRENSEGTFGRNVGIHDNGISTIDEHMFDSKASVRSMMAGGGYK